ncbi:insulin receptor-like isoform X2 [Maniola jurtina]|uniref:insulin receptor-like isoform X2 n=1 Tax=Maniola jurtina TaxID=191418 RepID=UPI001E68B4F1|nr:insulin receptor-like isoform X2 [Maniola jurtina]
MMRRACSWVAWPAVALALLLACDPAGAAADMLAPGICPSMDIRNKPDAMEKLGACRVIEGHLSIVLIEHVTAASFQNVSFPKLREVTGYILIYRLKGVRNLGDLFPNLSVIRGTPLFKDFALVIFDNGIESLGLRSLTRIERGAVRIQNNDQLCYANTIDWSRISPEAENNIIRSNYDTRLCGLCPNAQSRMEDHRQIQFQCPADFTGRLLCWDDKHCQKKDCPTKCNGRACMADGKCCHHTCLGGCDGPSPSDCHVCANFSLGYDDKRTCVDRCPANTYELSRRCVTEQECRSTPPPQDDFADAVQRAPTIRAYKLLFNRSCVYFCPSGYMEVGSRYNSTCQRCPNRGCNQECLGGKIDSITSAELFHGCTHVKGTLDISLRTGGGNTMAVLEQSLGEVREISGSLRVVRSYPLVSLMFLRSLRTIGGRETDNKGQSLYIFNNPNLELLWNWSNHGTISIERGKLFVHFNPKLCYKNIEELKNMTLDPISTFSETEVSRDNNGDQASCYEEMLHLKVHKLLQDVAILTWNMYCIDDMRKLLGFSIYFLATDHNVTLYGQRDACSDTWNVRDKTMEEVLNNTATTPPPPKDKKTILESSCSDVQPLFHPLTKLTPFTRYAAYVKTYTTQQDKRGAQSPIIYFKTLPGSPSPPLGLTVESLEQNAATVRWQAPAMPNGTIAFYHVEVQANYYNRPKILALNVNYCNNPSALVNLIAVRGEESSTDTEKKETNLTGDVKGEQCVCRDDARPATRFSSVAEEERMESIDFENTLQNLVYVKKTVNESSSVESAASRIRRSIDVSVNSMLVILSSAHMPLFGSNYTNVTQGKYVKSLYYDLDGSVRSLRVENMRHFTWYTVNIWACREKHENESQSDYELLFCSTRAHYTFRTLEGENADVVRNLNVAVLNKTQPELNVTWQPPEDPNGFVVAYKVKASLVGESKKDVGLLSSCTTAEDYEASGHSVPVRNLVPGNYSVSVTPVTLSGVGKDAAVRYVFIPERTAELSYEWVWGIVGGCLALLALGAGGVWYARRALLPQAETNKLFATVNPEYVSTVYVPDEWEVPRANIEFIRELGQGSFGMVYEGIAKNIEKGKPETRCAVKTVNEHATDRERIEFLNEASVMKAFDTFHVVRLLGVVSNGQPTLVVMELMECGDLKTYLRSHRPDAESSLPKKGGDAPPTLQNILQMAIEIADGMAYLSAKKFVHRDLAARNCMVAGDLTVKVGDFGMTRDIYETDYYRKGTKGLLPVRWMSPESLKDGVFSSSTDVWSYGVVLWEMATLAMQPYQGLSNEQVVRYVVEGGVMERPEHCPDRLYELMRACWAHRAALRPSFLQLVADLAPAAQPYFRHRSFFHTPQGQEMYALQRTAMVEEESESAEVNVGAVATGSGSNLFGVSGRLASWVRELSSLRSRADDDAAAEPLAPPEPRAIPLKARAGPNGVLREPAR